MKTQYQPVNGSQRGPVFDSMTAANCWVILLPDCADWRVELVRTPLVPAEDLKDAREHEPRFRRYLDLSGCCEARDLDP